MGWNAKRSTNDDLGVPHYMTRKGPKVQTNNEGGPKDFQFTAETTSKDSSETPFAQLIFSRHQPSMLKIKTNLDTMSISPKLFVNACKRAY